MKIKSMFAALAAGAIAVSALAVTASANITNATESDGKYCLNVQLPDGCKFNDIYGYLITLDGTAGEGETNVCGVSRQSTSVKWTTDEFCTAGGDKPYTIADDNTVKMLFSDPLFAESDEYAQVFVEQWHWDGDKQIDFSVTSIKLLDKDGNELTAKAAETTTAAPADTTTAAAATTTSAKAGAAVTTTKADSTKKADSAKTGDAGVGVAVAALGLAAAAAFTARKKH